MLGIVIRDEHNLPEVIETCKQLLQQATTDSAPLKVGVHKKVLNVANSRIVGDGPRQSDQIADGITSYHNAS